MKGSLLTKFWGLGHLSTSLAWTTLLSILMWGVVVTCSRTGTWSGVYEMAYLSKKWEFIQVFESSFCLVVLFHLPQQSTKIEKKILDIEDTIEEMETSVKQNVKSKKVPHKTSRKSDLLCKVQTQE